MNILLEAFKLALKIPDIIWELSFRNISKWILASNIIRDSIRACPKSIGITNMNFFNDKTENLCDYEISAGFWNKIKTLLSLHKPEKKGKNT